jgi:hypothetical protein
LGYGLAVLDLEAIQMDRFLMDFSESFVILFGAYVNVLAAGVFVIGMILFLAWATIPAIAKRV